MRWLRAPAGLTPVLYIKLSAFYLSYFAALGVVLPYFGPYLRSLGMAPAQIGVLLATLSAAKIVAPNLWGWVADHTGRRVGVIRLAAVGAGGAFLWVMGSQSMSALALSLACFGFFWHAALPQFEAVTFNHLGQRRDSYTGIRLWGSIGFIAAVLAVGAGMDRLGPQVVPWAILGLLVAMAAFSAAVPRAGEQPHEDAAARFRAVLIRPSTLALLAVCFLTQASHGPYYAFFSIYLADSGYSSAAIGELWALGVVAEIGVFLAMPYWLPRYGARCLLAVAVGLAGVRWVIIGWWVGHVPALIVAQLLHAASFGVFHGAAIQLINSTFVGRHQGRGQALYSSLSFGAGSAVGNFASGYGWQWLGPTVTYSLAGCVALSALIVLALVSPDYRATRRNSLVANGKA